MSHAADQKAIDEVIEAMKESGRGGQHFMEVLAEKRISVPVHALLLKIADETVNGYAITMNGPNGRYRISGAIGLQGANGLDTTVKRETGLGQFVAETRSEAIEILQQLRARLPENFVKERDLKIQECPLWKGDLIPQQTFFESF